jgi:phasin family protein
MTKAKDNIEMIKAINDKGYESFSQLTDITLKAWNSAVDKQISAYTSLQNSSLEQFRLFSEAKDYQEVVCNQMDMTRKIGEEMVSNVRGAVELSQKTGKEVRTWFESALNSVNEQLTKAAEKAT